MFNLVFIHIYIYIYIYDDDDDEPELPNEEACLRHMMIRTRPRLSRTSPQSI